MKKLFAEPEIEILNFLCNTAVEGSPDDGIVGGEDGGLSGGEGLPGIKS